MDGTILNGEPIHAIANKKTIEFFNQESFNLSIDEIIKEYGFITNEEVYNKLIKNNVFKTNPSESEYLSKKEHFMSEAIKMAPNDDLLHPLMRQFLFDLKKHKKHISVVTSSDKSEANHLLKKLKLFELFDFIITKEDTTLNKPHPDPYLLAIKYYKINDLSKYVIFEDSDVGFKSAQLSNIPNIIKVSYY